MTDLIQMLRTDSRSSTDLFACAADRIEELEAKLEDVVYDIEQALDKVQK